MSRFRLTILVACLAACGCGQTGKLYLPDRPSEVITRPAQSPPAEPAPADPTSDVAPPDEKPEKKKEGAGTAPPDTSKNPG